MPQRYEGRDRRDLTADQKAVLDVIEAGPRGGDMYRGPFKILLENPDLANVVQQLGSYIRYDSAPDAAVREIAILAVSRVWKCDYEWAAHYPIAHKSGVSTEDLESLRTAEEPTFEDPSLGLVYRLVTELSETRKLSDEIFQEAISRFGHSIFLDLVAIVGYYGLLAGLMNAFELEPPAGKPAAFA